jgi:glucoamylase
VGRGGQGTTGQGRAGRAGASGAGGASARNPARRGVPAPSGSTDRAGDQAGAATAGQAAGGGAAAGAARAAQVVASAAPEEVPGSRPTPSPLEEGDSDRPRAPAPEMVDGPTAFGAPGVPPSWAPGDKQAVGTALSRESPVWFTMAEGIVTEVYYPRVDIANTRDLQFLLVGPDADSFYEERRDTLAQVELADPRALAWDVTTSERQGRFAIEKRVITDPGRPALVMRCRIHMHAERGGRDLRTYLLLAPHVSDRGSDNTAHVARLNGRTLLVACRHDTYLALACSHPLPQASAGYSGVSDGWTDLRQHRALRWHFAQAPAGNVALVAEVGGDVSQPFSVALGFGTSAGEACAHAVAAADADFERLTAAYLEGWHAYCDGLQDLSRASHDSGRQYYLSAMVVRAHEDRENVGAHIASLAIPWGEVAGDTNRAGYHLVWPRDLYHAATARLAAGDAAGALASLHYLARTQREDGSWPQNFWVFGEPYWRGLQLDEIAFPILLAWQLRRADSLDWNPYPSLVAPAAYRIARVGPVTQQERWEENSGYSPSSLAAAIAALVCAAEFAAADHDPQAARYFLEVADYWAAHLEDWTYTECGDVQGFHEYYERIASQLADTPSQVGRVFLPVANLPSGDNRIEEASVVDGGFLELVRYGVRRPDDPHVVQTLKVYDAACKVETPYGPVWRRYTHDGYGQKDDGRPFDGTGVGRGWPLLTGERAHYYLAKGETPTALVQAMERLTTAGGMIPEQVWDAPDIPERGMFLGRPTGSAAPLVWAHAEYVKLLRSIADGTVFDCPPPVRQRYAQGEAPPSNLVIWKHNHKIRTAGAGQTVRIEVYAPAALHWTRDSWRTVRHEPMEPYGHGVWIYDFPPDSFKRGRTLEFTFYWNEAGRWEGVNYVVALH